MFFAEVNIIYIMDLKISSFYIFRTVKLPAVQKAVVGMSHGRGTRGRGTAGHGRRSSSRTYKSVEKIDVKDEPLSSDPVTITEEEDEDETIIKIIKKPDIKKGRVPKARRGKPFTASAGGDREIRKCSVEIVREDIQKGVKKCNNKKEKPKVVEEENKDKPKVVAEKKQGEQNIVEEKTQDEPKMAAEKTQDEPKIATEKTQDEPKMAADQKQDEPKIVAEKKQGKENTENGKNIVEEEVTQEKLEKNTEQFQLLTVSAYVKDVSDGSLDILSDESKKQQFDKMQDDLEVKKLERDVELVLDSRLRVNSTKERITNLKHILHLLSKYSDDEDEQKKTTMEKETQTERKDNNTNQDKEKEINDNHELKTEEKDIEAKPEYVKDENLPDEHEKKNNVDPEITENKPEEISKSQEVVPKDKEENSKEEEEKPEKTVDPKVQPMTESVEHDTGDTSKEKEKSQEDKNENVVEHEDEDKIKLKHGKNVPLKKRTIIEEPKMEIEKETKEEYVKDEKDKKKEKHVTFDLEEDNKKDNEERSEIQQQVNKALEVVNTLCDKKDKIDEEYEQFPSTQESGEKYCDKLKEKYSVVTEDITDDESEEKKQENDENETEEKRDITDKEIPEDATEKKDKAKDLRKNTEPPEVPEVPEVPDDLVYVESGSDFEDNLVEKWKDFKKGDKLRR